MYRKMKSPLEELGECRERLDNRLYENFREYLSRLDYECHPKFFPARVYYEHSRGNFSKVRELLGDIGACRNRKWNQQGRYFRVDLDIRLVLRLARSPLVKKIKSEKNPRKK